jgi:hypothetical protein
LRKEVFCDLCRKENKLRKERNVGFRVAISRRDTWVSRCCHVVQLELSSR